MSSMAGLLQYYFFPTDFDYPRPQPVNNTTSSQKQQQQQQSVVAVPAALKSQEKQDLADLQILENQEKPFKKLAIRWTNMQDTHKLVLKSSGAAAQALMFKDYGF